MNSPLPLSVLVCSLASAGLANAAPTGDPAAAEVLFQEARALLDQGLNAEACPKFLESQRLDPATGTLIAVASCHEKQGLLATAWSEYTEAAGRARAEGRLDRVRLVEARASALLPRLSRATVGVSPELAALKGLRIERDGIELGPMSLNRPLPIDQGEHTVRLEAPGYAPVEVPFSVGDGAERVRVALPMLQKRAPDSVPFQQGNAPPSQLAERSSGLADTQKAGVWLGSAGAASLAVAGGFLLSGLNKKQDADPLCNAGQCTTPGDQYLDSAVSRANTATYFALGGWALLAAGVTLYVVGDDEEDAPAATGSAPRTRSELAVQSQPGGASLQWRSSF